MRENSGITGFVGSFRFMSGVIHCCTAKRYDSSVKISRDSTGGRNAFTGYGEGWVEVNGRRHSSSLVVSGDHLDAAWAAASVDALTAAHFEAIAKAAPELVLLGTGRTFRFPDPAVLAPLRAARI